MIIKKIESVKKINILLKTALVMACMIAFLAEGPAFAAFFDTVGQTARPMGMGEVFLASSGDPSGYWYNPAGLSAIKNRQVGISYGVINPSISSDLMKYQLSYVNPIGEKSGFALGYSGLGADGALEMVLSGAYGISLTEKFALGANLKLLRWSTDGQYDPYSGKNDDDLSKTTFSIDLSGNYSFGSLFGLENLATGVYVKDANMPNISEKGSDDGKLPIETGVGLLGKKGDVTAEIDAAFVDGQTIFRGGAEFGVRGSGLKIRGGLVYGSDFEDDTERTDFDFGLGYVFNTIVFDYAYNIPIEFQDTGGRHFVSFGVSF